MFVLQICIGVLTALGLGFVLADVYHLPTLKARKATNNLGKKGERKVGMVEIYLKDFSAFLAQKLRLNEYKRAQLEADLKTAGMEITPEAYVADAITKALAIAVFAIPFFFIFKILSLVILFIAVVVYFKEYQAVSVKIKSRRQKIEYELPRLVSAIEKTMQHNRSVVYILESYKDTAGEELKEELEITVADMRSGNVEVALTRLENRIGSTMMSDITRGLAALDRGAASTPPKLCQGSALYPGACPLYRCYLDPCYGRKRHRPSFHLCAHRDYYPFPPVCGEGRQVPSHH